MRYEETHEICRRRGLEFPVALATTLAVLALLPLNLASGPAHAQAPGGMEAMLIDMDPAASPANTATSLGSRQFCARINENNTLDADEDSVDTLDIDVTATSIPTTNRMIAFGYTLAYNEANLTVHSADHNFLLATNAGSNVFDASQTTPDTNGDGIWTALADDVSDSSTIPPESGSGVLSRLAISSDAQSAGGVYPLTLTFAGHIDPNNDAWSPLNAIDTNGDTLLDRVIQSPLPRVAVNTDCGPPPTATPPGGMEAMSIDMDPAASPTNTATSLGSRETCARINKNNTLDADEDSIDTLHIDVTATNIPASNPMIAFGYAASYDYTNLALGGADNNFLLAANARSSLVDASFTANVAALDTGPIPGSSESGSGVLSRLALYPFVGTAAGVYGLTLSAAGHVDANGARWDALSVNDANVAIDTPCETPPPPTPMPPSTPRPPAVGGVLGLPRGPSGPAAAQSHSLTGDYAWVAGVLGGTLAAALAAAAAGGWYVRRRRAG